MGSPFASLFTDTISLPTDPGETITIQKLASGAIERAQAIHYQEFAAGRTPRGWAGIFQRLMAAGTATDADAAKALIDPLAGYDRLAIVQAGVQAWSYKVGMDPRPVTPEAIADLDDDAVEFLALAIMRLTKPGLFTSAEIEQKNG